MFFFFGSVFLTDEGKIVFALVVVNQEKKILALMQLNKNKMIELGSVYTEIPDYCLPYRFPGSKKIIMIIVGCGTNEKNILESSDMGKNWGASTETLFRHYEFLRDKYNFAAVKNGTKEVVLFTEDRLKLNANSNGKKDFYLWMSDGNRLSLA